MCGCGERTGLCVYVCKVGVSVCGETGVCEFVWVWNDWVGCGLTDVGVVFCVEDRCACLCVSMCGETGVCVCRERWICVCLCGETMVCVWRERLETWRENWGGCRRRDRKIGREIQKGCGGSQGCVCSCVCSDRLDVCVCLCVCIGTGECVDAETGVWACVCRDRGVCGGREVFMCEKTGV